MQIEYSLFRLSLFWASAWDPLNQKKADELTYISINIGL